MSRQPDPQKSVERLDTKGVLEAETKELWGDAEAAAIWSHPDPVGEYGRRMLRNDQAALCLSGGGIRSAAFALGVVQALARKNLLPASSISRPSREAAISEVSSGVGSRRKTRM